MTVKNAVSDVLAAVGVLQRARAACANLKPLSSRPMTAQELQQRAEMIHVVVRTRKLLQQIQDRTDNLESASIHLRI